MKMNYLDKFQAKVALIIITVVAFSIASPISAQQQQPPSPARTIQKAEDMLQSEAVTRIQPQYPPLALAARVSATVKVEITIDESGNVISARALSGHALLKDSAVAAARKWKFKPTMLEGIPVKVTGVISLAFDPDTTVPDTKQDEDEEEKQRTLTPEEERKLQRAEAAADRFIERWHETLDMNLLFEEMYVSDPEQRRRNAYHFRSIYRFIAGLGYDPGVEKGIDEALMRKGALAWWNIFYMVQEYGLATWQSDDGFTLPVDVTKGLEELYSIKLDEKYMRLIPVKAFIAKANAVSSLFRKHLPQELFNTVRYRTNLADHNKDSRGFRIVDGLQMHGVGKEVEVYNLRRGVFDFYFIEEGGELKVLTLGFEL